MKSGIMQPYLFPYLGYYQLVNSVDKFVFYDDVAYIKSGYINRNSILVDSKAQRFTVPVIGSSQNKLICDLNFDINVRKTLKTIAQTYQSAPFFSDIYPIIESVFLDNNRNVAHVSSRSISTVFDFLGIDKDFYFSSELDYDRKASREDKLIAISKLVSCNEYINGPGGRKIYDKIYFSEKGVELSFIDIKVYSYYQNGYTFIPHLSMVDVLMWNNKCDVLKLLDQYELN